MASIKTSVEFGPIFTIINTKKILITALLFNNKSWRFVRLIRIEVLIPQILVDKSSFRITKTLYNVQMYPYKLLSLTSFLLIVNK